MRWDGEKLRSVFEGGSSEEMEARRRGGGGKKKEGAVLHFRLRWDWDSAKD